MKWKKNVTLEKQQPWQLRLGDKVTPVAERDRYLIKAVEKGISNEEATQQLLREKEPSLQFTTPEELGELAVFFCSPAGNNVRGVAWAMDGGWTAQ